MAGKAGFVEALECRRLLSGNVVASLVDGNLIISGDAKSNGLAVYANAGGVVRLEAVGTTRLNGEFGPLEFENVTGDIRVFLRGGRDELTVRDIDVERDLVIRMGAGDDIILLRSVNVGRALRVDSGAGNDRVNLLDGTVARARVDLRAGNDLIVADGTLFENRFTLHTGAGADVISLNRSIFNGQQRIVGRPGADRVVNPIVLSYDFDDGARGWEAGFADYVVGEEQEFELESGIRPLPAEIDAGQTGFFLSSNNRSDDVLMYLTRSLGPAEGIVAGRLYQVSFDIRLASNATDAPGIGGSPGASVYLKAGAAGKRPFSVEREGMERLNLNHGQQARGGPAATVAGNISTGEEAMEGEYLSIRRRHVHSYLVRANENGRLHLLVGTDSGYEGVTAIYFQQIEVALVAVPG